MTLEERNGILERAVVIDLKTRLPVSFEVSFLLSHADF